MIVDPYELAAGKAVRLIPGPIGELVAAEILAARDLYGILGTSSLGHRVMRQIQEMSEHGSRHAPVPGTSEYAAE
jgi:hypothetical protein